MGTFSWIAKKGKCVEARDRWTDSIRFVLLAHCGILYLCND
jgi:hypothetical protein